MEILDLILGYFLEKVFGWLLNPLLRWVEMYTREARVIGLLWILYKTRRIGNARYQRRVEFVAVGFAVPLLLKSFTRQAQHRHQSTRIVQTIGVSE